MSWRTVVVTKPSKLDYSMGYMTVRDVENTVKIHLSEVSILIIENTACSITCALLSELSAKKIKVIFCCKYIRIEFSKQKVNFKNQFNYATNCN